MLQNVAFPGIANNYQKYGPVFDGIWWFQDGAPAHRSREIRNLLRQKFEDRVVSLHNDVEWPPRSPDLTPLDFFLWGYLKQKVFITPPANLPELRMRIVNEVNDLCHHSVFQAMRTKVQKCIAKNGSHIEC